MTFTITDGTLPVEGATIDVASQVLTTDTAGETTVNLEDGNYNYTVEATGFDSKTGTFNVSGASVNKTITLEETLHQITFNVTDGSNVLTDAEIIVNGVVLTTDNNGNTTTNLANGSYPYEVSYPDYEDHIDTITVENSALVENITLAEITYTVEFDVINGSSSVEGAIIEIDGKQLTTDASGSALVNLVNGIYNYTITKSGYTDATGSVEVSGANIIKEINLNQANYTVTFSVNYNSVPQENASIEIENDVLTTDENGQATIDLVNGVYEYAVITDTLKQYNDSVVVSNSNTTEVINLSPAIYQLDFLVSYQGALYTGATIMVDTLEMVTDTNGNAIFSLEQGTYDYAITTDSLATDSGSVVIAELDVTKTIQLEEKKYLTTFSVNHNTEPVEGATVSIATQELFTNAEGEAGTELADGDYAYVVTKEGFGLVSDSLTIEGSAVEETVQLSNETYTLTFSVETDTGALENVAIDINDTTLLTDNEGLTNVELLDGIYSYKVSKSGFGIVEDTVGIDGSAETRSVVLSDDKYMLNFTVSCDTGSVPDAEININDTTLLTNTDGEANIELFTGTYNYSVSKDGFGFVENTVEISNSDVNELVTLTDETFELLFTVKSEAGAIKDASISIDDSTIVTDASGNATISLLSGTYDYTITREGYEKAQDSIEIAGNPVTEEATLTPRAYSVDFSVSYNSAPVENATIQIDNSELITDSTGMASTELRNGTYSYSVNADGLLEKIGSITVSNSSFEEQVTLSSPVYEVIFSVHHESDSIPGAEIELNGKILTTDSEGMVTTELGKGSYKYTVTADSFKTTTGAVQITNSSVVKNIFLAKLTFSVTFIVNHESTPVEGADVIIDGDSLETNAEGLVVADLENGTYTYEINMPDFTDVEGRFTVNNSDFVKNVFLDYETFKAKFSVYQGSEPIGGATITIGDTYITTNNDGEATIQLRNGQYNYSCTVSEYKKVNDQIVIDGDDVMEMITLDDLTGIESIHQANIQVYPNPAVDQLYINAENVKSVELINQEGRLMMKKEGNINNLNVSEYEIGIYILNVRINGKIHTTRVLIQ